MELDQVPTNKHHKGPRACATCAKAKARCIPGPVDGICERCHRLKKPCSSQTPAPPRKRKSPKPTRVAELERRLEDLTARIESQVQPATPSESSASPSVGPKKKSYYAPTQIPGFPHLFPPEDIVMSNGVEQRRPQVVAARATSTIPLTPAISPGAEASQEPESAVSRPDEPTLVPPAQPGESLWPRSTEAEALLQAYRQHFAPLFPFVIIPASKASDQLRKEQPYVWKAVMMVALHLDGQRQIALGTELLTDIAVAAFTRPERSLDLLQGLLILIAWYHFNLHSFQVTNVLFLARSICVSLGFTESQNGLKEQIHSPYCLEQMRAFAGCYYLVTLVFTTNKKPDAFMNTSYLEACCQLLESKMEYPTDEFLVYLVRAQQLAQSISMTLAFRNTALQPELPLTIIIKSFQQQIESFRSSLPSGLSGNPAISAHVYVAEMFLYEIGTQDVQAVSYLTITDRLELLWSCLNAAKAFLAIRFEQAASDEPRFCMSTFDFVYVLITCLKLITLDAPGWDLNLARRELAFDKLVQRVLQDLRAAAERRKKPGQEAPAQEDPFSRLARKLEHLAECMAYELDNVYKPPAPEVQEQAGTLVEATQDITQDVDFSLWQELFNNNGWESFQNSPVPGWT